MYWFIPYKKNHDITQTKMLNIYGYLEFFILSRNKQNQMVWIYFLEWEFGKYQGYVPQLLIIFFGRGGYILVPPLQILLFILYNLSALSQLLIKCPSLHWFSTFVNGRNMCDRHIKCQWRYVTFWYSCYGHVDGITYYLTMKIFR